MLPTCNTHPTYKQHSYNINTTYIQHTCKIHATYIQHIYNKHTIYIHRTYIKHIYNIFTAYIQHTFIPTLQLLDGKKNFLKIDLTFNTFKKRLGKLKIWCIL